MATPQHRLEDNKAIVQRFFEQIDDHDPSVFEELFAEDFTSGIYRSGSEAEISGPDGMHELWMEYWEAFPDLVGTSTELIAEGDRVAVFRSETGTHEGEFRGIEPTGTEITFDYSGYFVLEDDRIVHGYLHGDMLNLLGQLGIESPFPR